MNPNPVYWSGPGVRVEQIGSRWQAKYYDSVVRVWFDIGELKDTQAEARANAEDYIERHKND